MKAGSELDAAVAEQREVGGKPNDVTAKAWADHQLNSAVAERVMGWRAHESGIWFNLDGERQCYTYDFDPKNKIAHAWQVVERLVANGYTFRVRFEVNQQWYCEFALGSKGWHVYSETAPHAISLAALEAVEKAE